MQYLNTVKAIFLSRINRFVAKVLLDSQEIFVHVKNTGRCRELLICGATVFLQPKPDNHLGKYKYSLIAVYKDKMLVNMDSSAPNTVVGEALMGSCDLVPDMGKIVYMKPEAVFEDSRFDFFVRDEHGREGYIEVKGVTLEENGVARFPDAPTVRGIKHLRGLERAYKQGFSATILFVVQMKGCRCFSPNYEGVPEFGDALERAFRNNVSVCAFQCEVDFDYLKLTDKLPLCLRDDRLL